MTWTYSGNPATSALDEVRFLLGDTDTGDQLLSNEEITYLLGKYADSHQAAAEASRAVAAKLSRLADKEVGDLKVKLSQKASHYANLASVIIGGAGNVSVVPVPVAGGTEADHFFTRETHDYSGGPTDGRDGWTVG